MPFETRELGDFIGKGITLPMKLVNGKPPLESGFDLIKSSLIMLLSWNYGSRYFLHEFGSKLYQLLEEPNDDILQEVIQVFVIDAINKWEPRIEKITSQIARNTDTSISLTITYRIIATQTEDTFTFPFYRNINY